MSARAPPPARPGASSRTSRTTPLDAGPAASLRGITPPPTVGAAPPIPPNWEEHYEQTIMSLSRYETFPVDPASQEFQTIADMVAPFDAVSVEQVVNPDLWRRFIITRMDMLRQKSEDLTLLKKLGFDDQLLHRRAYQSEKFVKDSRLSSESATYSPNEVLLFHSTRSRESVEKILDHGLDERLSSSKSGRLGKGIYFVDDPLKSCQYGSGARGTFLIFTVLLGDPLFIPDCRAKLLVREPEKEIGSKRLPTDQFFDAAITKPGGGANEYVIYNRGQCYPMYLIKYQVNPGPVALRKDFVAARGNRPTIAWNPMPNREVDGGWPLFAASLFRSMEKRTQQPEPDHVPYSDSEDDDDEDDHTPSDTSSLAASSSDLDVEPSTSKPSSMGNDLEEEIATIISLLGIQDEARIREALKKKHNDLDEAVNFLMENNNGPREKAPTTSGATEANQDSQSPQSSTPPLVEECPNCLNEYIPSSHSPLRWKELKCGHKLCQTCYKNIEMDGRTMKGVRHTSVKCPSCHGITGTVVGSCPNGTMTFTKIPTSCAGFPNSGSIEIRYMLYHGGQRYSRVAFLPDTPEGQHVLKLLESAWNLRLIFAIGTSNIIGAQNVPVWNIHHKTSLVGGVAYHGYPDPGYLDRVKGELKAVGIE